MNPAAQPQASGSPRKPDRVDALYSIASLLGAVSDPDEILPKVLGAAAEIVSADRVLLFTLNSLKGELELSASLGLQEDSIQDALDISRETLREAAGGKQIISLDTQTDEALRERRSIARFGIRSILCAPLVLRGETLGVLYIDSRQGAPLFSSGDIRFLEVFAQQATLAIDFARRFGRMKADTRRLQLDVGSVTERFGIIGRSKAIQSVWETIERLAAYTMPVLVHGETGTGKELVARAIHEQSPRRDASFLAENCAALPDTLLESQLFGHVRGAFTGATRDHEGLFTHADGGTLFLDEIGEMAPGLQARLLRVLQDGELRPVGSEKRQKVDVRIIAATNRNPQVAIEQGQMREDLFYRLAGVRIEIPPIRERREDIPLLFSHFVEEGDGTRLSPRIDPEIWKPLINYDWPGNVREIQNEARRLALLCQESDSLTLKELERYGCVALSPLSETTGNDDGITPLENSERQAITRALRASSGNRERAARLLGISRATLFRKIRNYQIQK